MNDINQKVDLYQLRNELLCYGINVSDEIKKAIYDINPFLEACKSIHVSSFFLGSEMYVNAPFDELYTRKSPYYIERWDNRFILKTKDNPLCEIKIVSLPDWYMNYTSQGTQMKDVFNVHGKNTLALSHYTNCFYNDIGCRCLFCSIEPYNHTIPLNINDRIRDIVETLDCAFSFDKTYDIALSEGTKKGKDRGARYFARIGDSICSKFGNVNISTEIAPPEEKCFIDLMINSGINSLIMNIEIFDESIRKIICPGKSEITVKHYFDMLTYSVKKLGVGNVSSVLIAGIEPIENTITCAKLLLSEGIIPTIIPFKPYDNCIMCNEEPTNPRILEIISKEIDLEIKRLNYPGVQSHSCISCGACNVKTKLI